MSYNSTSGTATNKYDIKTVVLFQHGYQGNAGIFTNLIKNILKSSEPNKQYQTYPEVIRKDSHDLVFDNLKKVNGKLVLIKTEFTNKIDRVINQVYELNTIITKIKAALGYEVDIILVGHSKGGLVNMKYAITYPGTIKKLVSVGTPYNFNFMGFAQGILNDLVEKAGTVAEFLNLENLTSVFKIIQSFFDEIVCDEDLGDSQFSQQLRSDWSSLPARLRPIITTIGCSQLGYNADVNTGGDLVVSLPSQLANGYSCINSRVTISENYIYIIHKWYDIFHKNVYLYEQFLDLKDTIFYIKELDALEAFFGIILTSLISNNERNDVYDLIHTRELKNESVALAVIGGIELESTNTLSPTIALNYN